MNYRHIYHAGNFADVFKHALLVMLLDHLAHKETPFCVLDTHAGTGCYDLGDAEASRTHEYLSGIGRLWDAPGLPDALDRYRRLVVSLETLAEAPQGIRWYPGSPWIARRLMRPRDRLVAVELHPDDVAALKRLFDGDRQVSVHHMDGYASVKAHLPPRERRGLVFMDPPYEVRDETDRLVRALAAGHRRFAHGQFALWYPIKERPWVWRFHEALVALQIPKMLVAEMLVTDGSDPYRMNGCGMVIVNPPWQLDAAIRPVLSTLVDYLGDGGARFEVFWLVPDRHAA